MPQGVCHFLKVEHELSEEERDAQPIAPTLRNTWVMQWIGVRLRRKTGVLLGALMRESVSQLPVPLVCQAHINFLAL
jgi:hypothetical protein